MRQNLFDWTPMFLLVVVSNGDLQLARPDEAFYERVRLIDCWRTIPVKERKTSVYRNARSGDPQCLRWLADGARDYVRHGLLPETDKMRNDRLDWQYNADTISKFIATQYEIVDKPTHSQQVTALDPLYMTYQAWMLKYREAGGTDKKNETKHEFSRCVKMIPGVIRKQWYFRHSELRFFAFNLVAKPKNNTQILNI